MRTSFNIPDDLLAEFDRTWQSEGFDSRSRAVREAMQEYIEAHTELETVSGDVTAALAFDYQHERVIRDLHDVQHDFQDIIKTTSHTHEGTWCLETIFCRGEASRVRELVYRLRDFDAVGQVNVLLLRS
ncbi:MULTISPECIES: CopG family ribbon-helix-helix protein [Natronorubrum]|uniref:CopG family transcriptional regulator n=2 Tax=Natronorubrum TaxID=134813 RepID=A0A1N7DU38_9EURY|nr:MULTISPECIES: CopG family ribbon-helix-helix protein [Natronorubrum]APX96172.1 CopG family transcriptional regulator [Natronorubrum daqingense]SEH14450.1 CopG family transcriptional regulator, nickel-responsive regulator [Natronorubrum sediminis]SIR79281.1 CopG family transcriptional regulator, nickel-responsive regulator [Natronorubrum daqingense]